MTRGGGAAAAVCSVKRRPAGRRRTARNLQPPRDDRLAEIELLYRAHFERFFRLAAGVIGDAELARDAVQEAFASAIRHRGDYRAEGPLEGWLWRTVLNTARRHRRRAIVETGAGLFSDGVPEASNGRTASDLALRALVAALPERQRLILFLRYYADLDYSGIAKALEIEPGTVGAALSAARARLRPALGDSP